MTSRFSSIDTDKSVIHVEDFFHPEAGYQLNTLARTHSKLGYKVYILCSDSTHIPFRLKSFFDFSSISNLDRKFELSHDNNIKIFRFSTFAYFSGRSFFYPSLFIFLVIIVFPQKKGFSY